MKFSFNMSKKENLKNFLKKRKKGLKFPCKGVRILKIYTRTI